MGREFLNSDNALDSTHFSNDCIYSPKYPCESLIYCVAEVAGGNLRVEMSACSVSRVGLENPTVEGQGVKSRHRINTSCIHCRHCLAS